MFQSICEILTFKTPFDELNDFLEKYEKLITMFEDYILNSGIPLEKIEKKDVNYDIFFY